MPHDGYKASGSGKDMSTYSFDEYTNIKHVMSDITGNAHKDWHDTIRRVIHIQERVGRQSREIAIRALRAAYELGMGAVAVPHMDSDSVHRLKADEHYQMGIKASRSPVSPPRFSS